VAGLIIAPRPPILLMDVYKPTLIKGTGVSKRKKKTEVRVVRTTEWWRRPGFEVGFFFFVAAITLALVTQNRSMLAFPSWCLAFAVAARRKKTCPSFLYSFVTGKSGQ